MAESLINYKIGGDKQLFFIGTERVIGCQSVQATKNLKKYLNHQMKYFIITLQLV
jgi:hypothetical protein